MCRDVSSGIPRRAAALAVAGVVGGAALVVGAPTAGADDVRCKDGSRDAARSIAASSRVIEPVGSVRSSDAEIKLRYSPDHKCAWGWISEPGDDGVVWVDRSTDNGKSWSSGRDEQVEIADDATTTHTGARLIGVPTPWTAIRACGHGYESEEVLGDEVTDDLLGVDPDEHQLAPMGRPGGLGRGGGAGKTVNRNGKKYRVITQQRPSEIMCTNWFDPEVHAAGAWCGPYALATPGLRESGFSPAKLCAFGDEVQQALLRARRGGPYPYPGHDGEPYDNDPAKVRDGQMLPAKEAGYYTRYTVKDPQDAKMGTRRLVLGRNGEVYYSTTHYESFYVLDTTADA